MAQLTSARRNGRFGANQEAATGQERLSVPVLILQGDNDIQVTQEDSRLLAAAKPNATRVLVAGMNHGLRISPRDLAGNLATYGDPSLPLAPEGVEAIVQFVRSAK
jgi:fermentation-respiration switch protein FrsA (DUF1100 family)